MRFTVHDSPDYYQLKVSVFNDDKKTELIGETWVSLEQIVVPGGGQNDLWHHLNCKGRFAGEIRIEITYYDTRPKEEISEGKHQETPAQNPHEQAKEGISGPRQPKPFKRRPLPADPTQPVTPQSSIPEPSQPSPMTYISPPSNHRTPNPQALQPSQSTEHRVDPSPLSKPGYQHLDAGEIVSPVVYNKYGQEIYQESLGSELSHPYNGNNSTTGMDATNLNYTPTNAMSWHHEPSRGQAHDQRLSLEEESYRADESPTHTPYLQKYNSNVNQRIGYSQSHHDAYSMETTRAPPSMLQQRSMPEAYPPNQSIQMISQQNHGHSSSTTQPYETPTRNHSFSANGDRWSSPAPDEDGPPPPPPIHRVSGNISSQRPERDRAESYAPIVAPAPLNVRNHRGSASGSPLAQYHNTPSYDGYLPSTSSPNPQPASHSGASVSSYPSNSQPSRKQSQLSLAPTPAPDFVHAIPPSLVPGYEPSVAEEVSERLLDERRKTTRRSMTADSCESHQPFPTQQLYSEPLPQYQPLPTRTTKPDSHTNYHIYSQQQQAVPSRSSQSQIYPSPRNDQNKSVRLQDMARERITHSSSAPIFESNAAKPDPRTPMRKSVSPAPERSPGERSTSAVPFSPDSYETFNPSLSAASSINLSGPQYKTPEQARDAFHERERETRLSEGPIIDSDGKVIDPSDHLPTDTWAPEPEPKPSRKGPEITLRFRHTPQGAQPMPLSARRSPHDRTTRPHSTSTPVYAHSPHSTSPASFTSRAHIPNRVQGSPLHPNSSPVVPTLHTYVARSAMPRAPASDHALPSLENDGYGHASPTYGGGSPSHGTPPPVPGKVPIAPVGRDMGMSALSEEMRRIDIGVGGGQARSRRSRFGA